VINASTTLLHNSKIEGKLSYMVEHQPKLNTAQVMQLLAECKETHDRATAEHALWMAAVNEAKARLLSAYTVNHVPQFPQSRSARADMGQAGPSQPPSVN
jgi:hypothetical protein